MRARPTFGFSWRAAARECGVKSQQSYFALIGLACRLVARRWALYTIAMLVAFAVQALLVLVWNVPHGNELGESIVLPLLVTLVYAFVFADAAEEPPPQAAVWERILERAWAVIVIDFVCGELAAAGWIYGFSSQTLQVLGGFLALGASVFVIFTDASATIDDDVTVWTVIPRAFLRSISATLSVRGFSRALALFSLQLLLTAIAGIVYAGLGHLPADVRSFWASAPLFTVANVPLSAILVLVYADAKRALANE